MIPNRSTALKDHEVVSHQEWTTALTVLLAQEKELTQTREHLARQRRALPWEKVEKRYRFDGLDGKKSLSDLFAGRSQLAVYHFMFSPEWSEGCKHCSFTADHYDGTIVHLAHRDVTLVAVSGVPLAKIEAFRRLSGVIYAGGSAGRSDVRL